MSRMDGHPTPKTSKVRTRPSSRGNPKTDTSLPRERLPAGASGAQMRETGSAGDSLSPFGRRKKVGVRSVVLRIRRQDGPDQPQTARWEEFEVIPTVGMTVAEALTVIERRPVTTTGVEVAPVGWNSGCQAEACGSCTMLINGRARLACSTSLQTVSSRKRRVVLEPLSKFPVILDLVVDRSRARQARAQLETWLVVDRAQASRPLPLLPHTDYEQRSLFDRCLDCAACLEACPEFGGHTDYVGPSAINRVQVANLHPLGSLQAARRLDNLMDRGGLADCGHANNCAQVCPAGIPLVDSLQRLAAATTSRLVRHWLLG
ncbi:2Fe-2S iron-sulfur cluster-binding protein [Myxococcota bacterium]